MIDIKALSCNEIEAFMEKRGLPAFRGRQLFKWLWKHGIRSINEVTEFSLGLRQELACELDVYSLVCIKKEASIDSTIKWAFGLRDGLAIESVLIPEKDHTTLCLSTQAGCAMGCAFCLTGRMGLLRNLEASEIAGQALTVIKDVSQEMRPRNLVFMGMGEPLANFDNLLKAIEILTHDLGLNFSHRRITVSTCGIAPKIIELGQKSRVGLAISLHATTDRQREKLMPINKVYPIKEVLNACKRFRLPPRKRITFEYLLIRGINDSIDDAYRLSELLRGIPSKINLIPFNASSGLAFEEPSRESVLKFQDVLKGLNHTVIIRKSKGRDINAACGQLFYKQSDDTYRGKNATGC